jgi:hypothetical protein
MGRPASSRGKRVNSALRGEPPARIQKALSRTSPRLHDPRTIILSVALALGGVNRRRDPSSGGESGLMA